MRFSSNIFREEKENILVNNEDSSVLYEAHFFGPFRVFRKFPAKEQLFWHRNKAKLLFKWFLLHPNVSFSRDQLVKLCWPTADKEGGIRNLHVALHYLRRQLETTLPPGGAARYLHHSKNGYYWFELDETWWTDTMAIQQFSARAIEHDKKQEWLQAIFYYRKVAEYSYPGFLPEDIYEDMFAPSRHQFHFIYMHSLERLITICLQCKMFDDAFVYAYQALAHDPYCEMAIHAIATIHLKHGDDAKALYELNYFQQFLMQELGKEPDAKILFLKNLITSDK